MNKFLILFAFVTNVLVAQNTCESSEETLEELNSITKCSIKDVKKSNNKSTRQISVRISAPKKRYLKKRLAEKKEVASGIDNLSTSGISDTNHSTGIAGNESLSINKVNIAALTNNLSAEEVKKASSFNNVDNLPAFENCKGAKKNDQLSCFNKEMVSHIEKHFNYPNKALIDKIQGKVWIRFIIDKSGNVTNIKTLGPKGGKLLNDEAVRVISKLPKFKPSVKKGEKIAVKYGLPIHFSLED